MTRIEKLNKIQDDAVEAWIKADCHGTLFMATGTGKTITSIKCMYKSLPMGSKIRFWGETIVRSETLFEDERKAYLKLYNKDFTKDFDITFKTYQSGPDQSEVALDVFDEIDFALTRKYHFVIKNSKSNKKLGLTGSNNNTDSVNKVKTPDYLIGKIRQGDELVEKGKITKYINKAEMLKVICPIVYEYNLLQAIQDGILNKYETTIISHILNGKNKYLKPFKKSQYFATELNYYQVNEKVMNLPSSKGFLKKSLGNKLTRFLHNEMKSKKAMLRFLLKKLGKQNTLIFGVRKELLYTLTDNVIEKKNYKEILNRFGKDINVVASAKMIKRGITPKAKLDNLVLASYYSTSQDFLQILGRAIRFQNEDKVVNIYIFVTQSTYEVEWLEKLQNVYNSNGDLQYKIPLNVTRTINSGLLKNDDYDL